MKFANLNIKLFNTINSSDLCRFMITIKINLKKKINNLIKDQGQLYLQCLFTNLKLNFKYFKLVNTHFKCNFNLKFINNLL